MNNLDINKAYNFSKLLKIDCLKQEIEEIIKGYTLNKMQLKNGEWTCSFHKKNTEGIVLTISYNYIDLIKYKDNNFIERIDIDSNLLLTSRSIDRRENGIVYSILQKQFMPSKRFNNEIVLTDLTEQRYVFEKSNFENLIDNFDFSNSRMMLFLFKVLRLERTNNLKKVCDSFSEFSTHMNNYYSTFGNARKIKDNIYPTRTYLNGREISNLYDIDGPDKLYRIFDLYKGVINSRNEKDLDDINLGFIDSCAYDLITLEGIREKENSLVGEPSKVIDEEYLKYLKGMLYRKYKYNGNLKLNRDSILAGITYQMSGYDLVKKMMKRKLDITYDESEQHKLNEEIKQSEDMNTSSSKSVLSRILSPFKKK